MEGVSLSSILVKLAMVCKTRIGLSDRDQCEEGDFKISSIKLVVA